MCLLTTTLNRDPRFDHEAVRYAFGRTRCECGYEIENSLICPHCPRCKAANPVFDNTHFTDMLRMSPQEAAEDCVFNRHYRRHMYGADKLKWPEHQYCPVCKTAL